MSSVQHLREFIRERLTAAAQEIFTEVEKTIICYEEELDAQRRMMGINWKPEIKLHRIGSELQRQSSDLQEPSVSNKEENPAIQQVFSLASRSSYDQKEHQWTEDGQMEPEPKWIKKEEEEEPEPALLKYEQIEYPLTYVRKEELDSLLHQHEQQPPEHLPTGQNQKNLCSSQEGEQLVQKQFVALIETSTLQEDDMNEEERTEQLSLHISPVVESKDQEGSSSSVSESQAGTSAKKKSFKCDICGICYPQQCKLKKHYRTHTGERPFSCETCGKSFSLSYVLNRHKAIHTGERPFLCHSCGKSFCQISILNRHKTIHSSEKPFSCQTCGRRFNRRDNLNIHMKTHTARRLL
ncbi:zinc finger and SCAN domain-containing protein 12-like [Gambusia affinis]|uniref:zinc finger and SCAN domain-containing protein 12-like n=1 Tax=Gambusia affinis TaxID=33528 RepID=UPI001CDC526D|nr:zinc finger and SCAN domain-containing protein 12-like [Gambusia affinis]